MTTQTVTSSWRKRGDVHPWSQSEVIFNNISAKCRLLSLHSIRDIVYTSFFTCRWRTQSEMSPRKSKNLISLTVYCRSTSLTHNIHIIPTSNWFNRRWHTLHFLWKWSNTNWWSNARITRLCAVSLWLRKTYEVLPSRCEDDGYRDCLGFIWTEDTQMTSKQKDSTWSRQSLTLRHCIKIIIDTSAQIYG